MSDGQGHSSELRTLQIGMEWLPENPGGLNRFYYELIRRLPGEGVRVRGLVAGSPAVERSSGGHVRAVCHPAAPVPLRLWRWRRQVSRELRTNPIHLLVGHFALYTFPALSFVRGDLPLVVHFQGPWALEGREEGTRPVSTAPRVAVERSVYRRAARLLVLSDAFARILLRCGIPEDRIRKVPGGVDADRFAVAATRSAARQQLGWENDRPTVLTVRRLVRRVGLENLLAAAADVRRSVPDVLIRIAGTGPMAGELKERIRTDGLDRNVRLLGLLPEEHLPLAYRAADLTVVPSIALEGFGLSAAESLAAGTPVLVTPVDGLPETVAPLSPALVLESTGRGALADCLTRALRGELTLPVRVGCQAYARSRFDWPVVVRAVAAAYREAVQ
jgi:glycosyltransferase involved in cell wall biosynthesis